MLTRHRHACVVIGRVADRDLVRGIPPATPSYVGWEPNPALDGWYVHEAVFAALGKHDRAIRKGRRLHMIILPPIDPAVLGIDEACNELERVIAETYAARRAEFE